MSAFLSVRCHLRTVETNKTFQKPILLPSLSKVISEYGVKREAPTAEDLG